MTWVLSYRERQRLADIQAAIDAIHSHLQRGDLSDSLIFDAVHAELLAPCRRTPQGTPITRELTPLATVFRIGTQCSYTMVSTYGGSRTEQSRRSRIACPDQAGKPAQHR
jgi:hypothetical protein